MTSSKPPAVQSPHDALFKATFSSPAEAAALLRSVLPAELAQDVDWTTLALEPGSFVDDALAWRHTDLLFRADRLGQPVLLYWLIEHQSRNDSLMSFRLSTYVHRVLERYVSDHPGVRELPWVLPLVVSHAPRPWSAPLELLELFGVNETHAAAPHLPKLRYFLDDLSAQTEEALEQRGLSPEAVLTFLALRQARVKTFVDALKRWASLLRRLQAAPDGLDKTAKLLTYMLDVGEDAPEALGGVLQDHLGPEASEIVMSTAERLREEGREQGREQGRREGRLEGQAALLLRQLTLRFGPVPQEVADQVAAADSEQLERWAAAVLTATSVDSALS